MVDDWSEPVYDTAEDWGAPVHDQPKADRGFLGKIDDVVRMVANGATMGWADEASAKARELMGQGDYASNVAQERARDAGIMKDAPIVSNVAKIAGAVASPLTRLAGAAGTAANLPRYVNYAAQGGLLGGLTGAGESTEGNRTAGGLLGGGIGAVTGVAIPALLDVGSAAVRRVADRFSAPETAMGRTVARTLARDSMTPDEAQRAIAALGPEATPADLGGNMRGLAEAAASVPSASVKAAESLKDRAYGQTDRIRQAALEAAGASHVDELIAKRSTAAAPLYEKAFAQQTGPITTKSNQITNAAIERLLTRPDVQDGVQRGIKDIYDEAAITGNPVNLADYALARNEAGQFEKVGTPTLRLLDAAKRGLDEKLNSGELLDQFGRKTQRWYRIDGMRQTLLNSIEDMAPKDSQTGKSWYKLAREAWSGPSDLIGGLSHIDEVLNNARDGSDVTGRLFGSPSARAKLEKFFGGDEEKLAKFANTIKNEKTFADTMRTVTSNIRTAFRTAAKDDMAGDGTDAIMEIATNPTFGNFLKQGAKAAKNWAKAPPTGVADSLTGLYSKDPAIQKALLDEARRINSAGGLLDVAIARHSPGLLLGASRVGGYEGGLLGANR